MPISKLNGLIQGLDKFLSTVRIYCVIPSMGCIGNGVKFGS